MKLKRAIDSSLYSILIYSSRMNVDKLNNIIVQTVQFLLTVTFFTAKKS